MCFNADSGHALDCAEYILRAHRNLREPEASPLV